MKIKIRKKIERTKYIKMSIRFNLTYLYFFLNNYFYTLYNKLNKFDFIYINY